MIAYGVANAVLYCSLVPLWEGFDEAFHYGYVQILADQRRLPVLARDTISAEIWESLKLAPMSHVVQRAYPELTTFAEFFQLPAASQAERRERLDRLSPALRAIYSGTPTNYELQQAPLAYAVLALPDGLWRDAPLPARVWRLRLVGAILSCLLLSAGALYLSRSIGLNRSGEAVLLFLTFSSQMLYATTCHVANEWLAVPLAAGVLGSAVRFHRTPGLKNACGLAVLLSLGLLTKAYFLAFVPGALALLLWHAWREPRAGLQSALAFLLIPAIAGPWYVRNLVRYGNVSGMVEPFGSVSPRVVLPEALHVPWLRTIAYMARGSLWTGNNTFSTFSRATLDVMLLLVCAGLLALVFTARAKNREVGVGVLLGGILCCIAALAYVTLEQHLFLQAAGGGVWYTQPLLVPVMCLVLAGLGRIGAGGRWLRAAMLITWTYVMCATWWAKLIPLYGGYAGDRATAARLLTWYRDSAFAGRSALSHVALLPAGAIYALAAAVTLGAAALCGLLLRPARRDVQSGL